MRDKAKLIVKAIIKDLINRKGLRQDWDLIDDSIKREIISSWLKIVTEILEKE